MQMPPSDAAPAPCIVEGCPWHASFTAHETLHDYCPQHAEEWVAAEEEAAQ